jgi:UDP-glucose 4-epimerase
VGDVVRAALAAAGAEATGPINVGTGIETDVLTLIERLAALEPVEGFEAEFAPERTGEVQSISIDPGRAERELGWRAETGLDEGLRLTLESL